MGIRDFIRSRAEAVKRNAPDFTTVKNACRTSCDFLAACHKIDNVVGLRSLQMFSRYGANSKMCTVTNAALALHESYRSDPVMDTVDMVWISVCYPVKYEQSVGGVWKWKYTENDKRKTIPILVSETISYMELYDKVKEALEVDTELYKVEMSALVPIMREAPAAPIIIDCDNNVKWFVSACRETFLCVTISNEFVQTYEKEGVTRSKWMKMVTMLFVLFAWVKQLVVKFKVTKLS